jgi:ATP-dependent DNA helicase PIF1
MANSAVLSCVDDILRRCMGTPDLPFGGKVVILLGDFRQTSPVIPNGSRQDIINASIRTSPLWPSFTVYRLTQPIRNASDPAFSAFVEAIGEGILNDADLSRLTHIDKAQHMVERVFPPDILADPLMTSRRSIITVTNAQADGYNDRVLKSMPDAPSRTYYASDSIKHVNHDGEEAASFALDPTSLLDYVAKHTPPGCPPHALQVKVGGVYRLMRNLSIDRQMVKNVRVLIRAIGDRVVTVQTIHRDHSKREDILIPRICFEYPIPRTGHTVLRRQFPLAPAYASTFNSAQGLTLDFVGIDLTRPVFSHGQLYTALSRVRQGRDCVVRLPRGEMSTLNVVYPELLLPEVSV